MTGLCGGGIVLDVVCVVVVVVLLDEVTVIGVISVVVVVGTDTKATHTTYSVVSPSWLSQDLLYRLGVVTSG